MYKRTLKKQFEEIIYKKITKQKKLLHIFAKQIKNYELINPYQIFTHRKSGVLNFHNHTVLYAKRSIYQASTTYHCLRCYLYLHDDEDGKLQFSGNNATKAYSVKNHRFYNYHRRYNVPNNGYIFANAGAIS